MIPIVAEVSAPARVDGDVVVVRVAVTAGDMSSTWRVSVPVSGPAVAESVGLTGVRREYIHVLKGAAREAALTHLAMLRVRWMIEAAS